MMEPQTHFLRFGVALAIGILVGLQREFASPATEKEIPLGVRTFGLIGLLGCTAAMVGDLQDSAWPFVAIALVIGGLLALTHLMEVRKGHVGLTTEVSALCTFLVGALVYWDQLTLAGALGVSMAVLLSAKLEMHRFVKCITRTDVLATLKFAVITAIVLPVLPDRVFGPPPFNVLNPFRIWLLVVFISGISFVGYILIKIAGTGKGIRLTGLLGGLASSTAVTLSFTQRSQSAPGLARPFALAILIAWTVMFSRVLMVVAAVNIRLIAFLWLPVLASVLTGLAYGYYLFRAHRRLETEEVSFSNPFELAPAVKFGLLFAVVLLISNAAQVYLGRTGIYLSSLVAGLADADAIALSVSQISTAPGRLGLTVAGRAIMIAAAANTFAKGMIVMIGGAPALKRALLPGYLLMMGVAVGAAFLVG